jgi:hypothetical protein
LTGQSPPEELELICRFIFIFLLLHWLSYRESSFVILSEDLRPFLEKLRKNLNILKEREAKYAGEAPLSLLNQIEDYETAISLTKDTLIGDISPGELAEAAVYLLSEKSAWITGQVISVDGGMSSIKTFR